MFNYSFRARPRCANLLVAIETYIQWMCVSALKPIGFVSETGAISEESKSAMIAFIDGPPSPRVDRQFYRETLFPLLFPVVLRRIPVGTGDAGPAAVRGGGPVRDDGVSSGRISAGSTETLSR